MHVCEEVIRVACYLRISCAVYFECVVLILQKLWCGHFELFDTSETLYMGSSIINMAFPCHITFNILLDFCSFDLFLLYATVVVVVLLPVIDGLISISIILFLFSALVQIYQRQKSNWAPHLIRTQYEKERMFISIVWLQHILMFIKWNGVTM